MTREERQSLVHFKREYVNMTMDISCLEIILDKSEILGRPAFGWKDDLKNLLATPHRAALVRAYQDQIDQFELGGDETQSISFLEKLSKDSLPN